MRAEGTGETTLFEVPGVEWIAVSRRLARARIIVLAIWVGLPAVAATILGLALASPWFLAGAGVGVLLLAWCARLIIRQVKVTGYAERADDLLIRHGILFRHLLVVPYGRMQFVDVQVGPLDRALGIATLELHTASPSATASINGLLPDEAARLRDRLASRGEADLAGL